MIFWLIVAAIFSNFTSPFVADFFSAIYWDYTGIEIFLNLSNLIRYSEVASFIILGSPFLVLAVFSQARGKVRLQ